MRIKNIPKKKPSTLQGMTQTINNETNDSIDNNNNSIYTSYQKQQLFSME